MAGNSENKNVYISINGEEVKNTYRGIRAEVMKLRGQLLNTTRGTEEFEQASRKLKAAEKEFEGVRKEVGFTNRALQKGNEILGGLKGALLGAFSVSAVMNLTQQVVGVRTEFERYFAVLKVSLGSAKAANREFEMIREFAAETPFSVAELTDSFVRLTNQGFKPTREEMRQLGDLAASTGKQYDQLAEAILDAQTGEFERLKEFGILAEKEGNKVNFMFKEQQTQVDFTAESIQEYILGLGDLAGVSGSMAEISKTLGGRISNLKDAVDQFFFLLGDSPVLGETVRVMSDLVGVANEWLEVPMSEKVEEERMEMNALFEVVQSSNITQQQRSDLITKINNQYGSYFENLLTEKSSIDDIRIAQEQANTALERRVLLMATQEEQQEMMEKAVTLQRGIFDMEKMIADYREKIKNDPSVAEVYSEEIDFLADRIGEYKEALNEANADYEEFARRNAEILTEAAQMNAEDEDEDPVVTRTRSRQEKVVAVTKDFHNVMTEMEGEFLSGSLKATTQVEEQKRQQVLITSKAQRDALNHLVGDLQVAASEFPAFAEVAKKAAAMQAMMDTYAAAQSSYKALSGIPVVGPALGAAAAAAAVFAGMARVRKIQNTKFAAGGFSGPGVGMPDETGFKPAGIVHEEEWVSPKWMNYHPRYAPVIKSLEYARANNIGRYDNSAGANTSQNVAVSTSLDAKEFSQGAAMFRAAVMDLVEKGVVAVADDRLERDLREKRERDDFIIDKSRI